MAEKTSVRLDTIDLADGTGWQVDPSDAVDVFIRGSVTIEIRYAADDDIDNAVKRHANSDVDAIGRNATEKVERIRAWLEGRRYQEPAAPVIAPASTADATQMYSDFWRLFRVRVAAEHPHWRARAGTSRTTPNSTLPEGTPRVMFCSAFKPGPLRLELAFVDPNPAVNVDRFEALRARRSEFEQALGEPVVWDEMPGRNDTRVYVESFFASVDDRERWGSMMDWLIEMHGRFKAAIHSIGGLDSRGSTRHF